MKKELEVRMKAFIERNPHKDALDLAAHISLITGHHIIKITEWLMTVAPEHEGELNTSLAKLKKFYQVG